MTRTARVILALTVIALAVVPSTKPIPAPVETPPPIIEIHRSTAAGHFDIAKTNPIFVLVMGSDIRRGNPRRGRADAIQIVAVDTRRGRGTIIGIPRDSYVEVPGSGRTKINSALHFGGPERVVAAVSRLSGIRFHYWATIEFSRFRRLVDRIGGLNVTVPYAMKDRFSGANFKRGRQHMDGKEALAFARNRKDTPRGDFSRSENQGRLLIEGLRKFQKTADDPLQLARYFAAFHKEVVTNVGPAEFIDLALAGRRVDPKNVRSLVLPGGAGSAGGASVVILAPRAHDILRRVRDDGWL